MQYRRVGSTGVEVSALGFGCMRLPKDAEGRIDRPLAETMLDRALEQGVNYIDTAWPYHDGESEPFVGEYLAGRKVRDKLYLATKLPCWLAGERGDFDKYFDAQLERLKTDYIDFYLLHALDASRWPKIVELGIIDWMREKLAEGRIRHIGFSFHDEYPAFEEILGGFEWDFCQLQYNYMDVETQAGRRGVELAHQRGVGVVVMEPLLGGRLVNPPASVVQVMGEVDDEASAAELALKWLWDQEEVGPVLSGMSSLEQVEENLACAEDASPGCLTLVQRRLFDEIRQRYSKLTLVPCTACGYCMPCPHDVDIPGNFRIFNAGFMYNNLEPSIREYGFKNRPGKDARAAACVQCGECEPKCPQSIPISAIMSEVDGVLSRNTAYKESHYYMHKG